MAVILIIESMRRTLQESVSTVKLALIKSWREKAALWSFGPI